ncbi:unnamed protein product [Schistocephalus solidus]|uniref:Ig-like domain-containing protein n=1 Tax=Schistocephalus solidus TaxID=70667 RepID=A0A183SKS4_SCHSO|nr:unnamed protein product [Schistocephalus solidus]
MEWDKKIDAPIMLRLEDHPNIAKDPQDGSYGYIKNGNGLTSVKCAVIVTPSINLQQNVFSKATEIMIIPSTDVCTIKPEAPALSTIYDVTPNQVITFGISSKLARSKFKLRISMSNPVDEDKVIVDKNTLKFVEGAPTGIYTVTCVIYLENLEETSYVSSEHNLLFIAPPTVTKIVPEYPQLDGPIFCVTNEYPSGMVNISWIITDAKSKKYTEEKNVLFLSDFGSNFTKGSTIQIECRALFVLDANRITTTSSIKFTLPVSTKSFSLNYNKATLSLSTKLILLVFCFLAVIVTLFALLLPVILPSGDTSPLNALNYHIHARLQEHVRRRALAATRKSEGQGNPK